MVTLICLGVLFQNDSRVDVRIDPRVELLTGIFRLQGASEYNMTSSESAYIKRFDSYMAPYKSHPAVRMATRLRETSGIGFDAVPWLAVHVTDIRNPQIKLGNHKEDWDRRWKRSDLEKFLPLVADFVRESKFEEFLKGEQEYLAKATKSLEALIERRQVGNWIKDFYGKGLNSNSYAIVGMFCGGGNYGVSFRHADEQIDATPVLGAGEFDIEGLPVFGEQDLGLILHEFSHPYINPVVAQQKNILELGAPLFKLTKNALLASKYGSPDVTMFETFTRAAENTILQERAPELAEDNMLVHRMKGFLWQSDITDAFREASKTRRPIKDRLLQVLPVLERLAKRPKDLLTRCPKVKAFKPSQPTQEGDVTLRIEFDMPMNRASRGLSIEPDGYEVTKKTEYAEDGRSLQLTLRLKKGVEYTMTFNKFGGGYFSQTGYPVQVISKKLRV